MNHSSTPAAWSSVLAVALLIVGHALGTAASADVIHHFSEFSSDETTAADLTASAQYSISGTDLDISINNPSDFSVSQLYFNSDEALTGLEFDPLSGANPAWSITGTGASQGLGADGFGGYNWLIDFGSGGNRLGPGVTNLSLDMTGESSEGLIATKFSSIPPGDTPAVGAMKFEAGPGDDGAFGSARETELMLLDIRNFIGMTSSVPFTVGDLQLETGPVVTSLYPGGKNFFGLDSELLQGFIDVTLLLEFPEFAFPELLGDDPIIIRIIESGPAEIFPHEDETGFFFSADLTGGGTINEGLFAGLSFTNVNQYLGEGLFGSLIVRADVPVSWSLEGTGMVTFPPGLGGGTEPIDGSGFLNVVPEPGGILLAIVALAALLPLARRFPRTGRAQTAA